LCPDTACQDRVAATTDGFTEAANKTASHQAVAVLHEIFMTAANYCFQIINQNLFIIILALQDFYSLKDTAKA